MKQTMITTLISLLALLTLSFFLCIGLSGDNTFHLSTFILLVKILGIIGTITILSEYILYTYNIQIAKK